MSVVVESARAEQASQTTAPTTRAGALGVVGAIAGSLFGKRG